MKPTARRAGNFIDTANFYTGGTSETFVGEFISGTSRERRFSHEIFQRRARQRSEMRRQSPQEHDASSGSQSETAADDYIDLYWVHIWDGITPVEEVMRGLDDLVRQGKVLYVGISDAPAWWIVQANTLADLRGWTQSTGLQIEYS